MPDTADPRSSWNLLEICNGPQSASYAAKNDLYGMLFNHLRETILGFCRQIAKRDISIRLLSIDSLELPRYFNESSGHPGFDRIDTYVTAEKDVLGIDINLAIFSQLLKPKIQNPKAMVLVLFVRDIDDMWSFDSLDRDIARAAKYLPEPQSTDRSENENQEIKLFFLRCHKYGLKMRGNNTIVAHWPMRPGKHTTQRVFDILEASGATGCERYIEWEWE
ncbi:hypothetical protein N7463_003043 [Penicillium fimorum]|uniref:Uncharacterized protein n=1 Tax=Penicillium fimorum TaxID=1882269 RepID=A0A9W9Y0E7_9EURO|nr:hypothetical protein N7463_003043 [Penicillium fimorum]